MPRPPRPARPRLCALEARLAPATDVLAFHGDLASTGVVATEAELAPANVAVGTFGKHYAVPLDGQVYAQPLVKTGVTIAAGPNTTPGAAGIHDVVYVATQHDSVYALDAADGAVLWKRSFLDTAVPENNTLGASAIAPVPSADTGTGDITVEVGITGTPVIDPATGTLFVVAKTREAVGATTHYVQRLHALNLADGTDRTAPFVLGNTVLPNANTTPIYVYGSGEGSVTDPYNGTGRPVVQFNALREHQRSALTLTNGQVYVAWASHGDNGPYHGWVVSVDVSHLGTTGLALTGVFNASPNDTANGIWQGGGKLAFEPDGSAFYLETGNGAGGAPVLNAAGFPEDGNYNEALVKVVADPTTTPASQNANGWGLKVADYFIPYNVAALDGADSDFGSGAPVVLPDAAGIPGHPHLIVAGGKEGKLYVFDRDNLGRFDPLNDRALNAAPDGSGHTTPPRLVAGGLFSTPAWFNGKLYAVGALNGPAYTFNLGSDGSLTAASETAASTFGGLAGSPIISANGTNNGVVWVPDRARQRLHAYDAATLATELWNSDQRTGGADAVGAVVKFAVPTVANGQVYVGTASGLTVYGHFLPPAAVPLAPTLNAVTLSGTSINLTWADPTPEQNLATSYVIEESLDGATFNPVTTAPAGSVSLAVGGLQPLTHYFFRVRGLNALGSSPASNIADATTAALDPVVDYSAGFTATGLTLNGSAHLNGTRLELTNGASQSGTAFFSDPVDVTGFSTRFTFQLASAVADGFTFAIQNDGPTARGTGGGDLGYAGIDASVAVKFDLFNNAGEGDNSTGLYTGGEHPMNAGSVALPAAVNLHSGQVFQADLDYDGTRLRVTITDTETTATTSRDYVVDIPARVGGTTAYVGFTGGTGGLTAVQDILSWVYAPGALFSPNAPTGLGAVPASAAAVRLTWTANATNQTGYHLDRATDPAFTENLITEVLPAAGAAFTDTAAGLVPGGTYYYRLRAYNSAGDSGGSNVAQVTIPVPPPTATNQQVTGVTATSISLSWQDNAGHQADGYRVLRAADHGAFVPVATLPPTSRTPPSTYEWTDENLTPATYYEYHVVAYNVSGNNDFAGTNATTLTSPPTSVTATPDFLMVNLAWTAPAGAVSFNVYRGTTPGGEDGTPLATGLTDPEYADTEVTPGTTYYYTVTAVNANASHDPPLPAESAPSAEVSAAPVSIPAAPTGVTATSAVNTAAPGLALTWDASAGADGYNVYRSTNASVEPATPVASGRTGTSYTDPNVTFGTTYFYRVSAVNLAGEGARSAAVRATPLFAAHVNFTSPTGEPVPGHLADTGAAYGDRGNGLAYGWTRDDTARAFDRDAAGSPDELHDSFHDTRAAAWHLAVPNGTYRVRVLAGDPLTTTGTYRLNVGDTRIGGVAAIRGKPTAANPWVENTVTVTVTHGALWVHNAITVANRLAAVDVEQVLPGVDLAAGFSGARGLQKNGAFVVRGALRLTGPTRNLARSVFTTTPVSAADFHTAFDIRQTNAHADGLAFVLQGVGPRARGLSGEGLGYAGVARSVAVTFDLFDNAGEGANSTGLYLNGVMPSGAGTTDLTPSGIDLHSGHVMHADIDYAGGTLTVTLRDTVTGATATQSYVVDVLGAVSGPAYVGFTAGTSSQTAVQEVLNWTYTPRS